MGLFGLIKRYGEETTVTVREWMGTDYFAAAAAAGVGLFAEEATNAYMVAKLNLSGNKALAYKILHRLLFSALYYFGGKKMGKPFLGLSASLMPIVMIIVDALNHVFKVESPQQAGLKLAYRFNSIARASAGVPVAPARVAAAPVSPAPAVTVTVQPETKPSGYSLI